MTTVPVHCPYCNATITPTPDEATRPRLVCPRCGDSFPNRPEASAPSEPEALAKETRFFAHASGSDGKPLARSGISNTALARLIVGAMLFVGVVGMAYALVTVNFRRANDVKQPPTKPPRPAPPSSVEPVPTVDLAGLGYLPADCCLVAGLHVAQLRDNPDAKKLLEQLRSQVPHANLEQISKWTGLKPEQIDHVVIGLRSSEVQAATVVIRTRTPFSQEALAKAMKSAKASQYDHKPVYRFQQETPKRMLWWFDDRTLIVQVNLIGVELEDLQKLPVKPRTGAAGLSPPILEVLHKRLDKHSAVWAAGELSQIKGLPLLFQFLPKVPQDVKTLVVGIDGFGIGLQFGKDVTLNAAFQGKDVETATSLQQFLERPTPNGVKVTTVGPLSEKAPTDVLEQRWVMLQMKTNLQRAVDVLTDSKLLLPEIK